MSYAFKTYAEMYMGKYVQIQMIDDVHNMLRLL